MHSLKVSAAMALKRAGELARRRAFIAADAPSKRPLLPEVAAAAAAPMSPLKSYRAGATTVSKVLKTVLTGGRSEGA